MAQCLAQSQLRLGTQGNVIQRLALSHLRLGTLLSYLIKNFWERRRSRSDEKYLRLETQGNVVQCLALSHLRLGTLLSYLIKNFTGAEAKPERRKIPEVRNPG